MTVYQRCPFCEHVFELGPADYYPMTQHIRVKHSNGQDKGRKRQLPTLIV
jgi:hypothetical protein